MACSVRVPLFRFCPSGPALLAASLLLAPCALSVARADAGVVAAAAEASDRRDGAAAIWPAALATSNPEERVLVIRALGRLGGDSVVPALLPLLQDSAASVRAEAAFALAIAGAETDSVQQEIEQALLRQLGKESALEVRLVLLRALGNVGGEASQLLLRDYLRTAAKPAAEQAAWAQAVGLLWSYRRAALTAIDPALVKQLLAASSRAEPVGEMAAFALARGRKEPAVQAQAKALQQAFANSRSESARIFLLRALSQTVTDQNSKRWLQAQQRNRVAGRTLSANERVELQTLLAGQLHGPALREAVARALRSAASAERVAVLQTLLNRPAELEPLRDLLQSQQQLQPADSAWLAPLLQPPTGAAEAGNATGSEADSESREPAAPTLSYADASRAVGRRFRLHTVRGAIDIVLLPEAVYTAANFAKLADSGFYNGTVFHRVIGNFVAQGGDPTATGEGGPGWRIREELSQLPHAPGYIGVATSGKDTGGSQFFINTGRNPHLDWHYTVFAKVEAGLEVAMALRQMDTLLAVTPLP